MVILGIYLKKEKKITTIIKNHREVNKGFFFTRPNSNQKYQSLVWIHPD